MILNRQFFYDKKRKKIKSGLLWRYNGETYNEVPFL